MAELNGLPIFYIKCNESPDSKIGVDFISLVDCPAIETNWIAMANDKKPMKFTVDEDKQLLYGPILIPDLPIYRNDSVNGEHYVVFTKEEIQKLVRKFQLQQKSINLNLQHKENSKINSAVVQEIWLTGSKDKSQDLGFDLPVNSAFVCAYIGDKYIWKKEVKSGNVKGFSIEGFLDMEMKAQKKFNMNKQKFAVYKQADGNGDVYVDGELKVDNYVFSNYPSVVLKNGVKEITQYPVWQDTLVLEDGTILTLKDSKILKIEQKVTQSKNNKMKSIFSIMATAKDGTVMISEESEFKVGTPVTSTNSAGASVPVPDGDYSFDNGDVATVKDGVITVYTPAQSEEGEMAEVTAEQLAAIKKALGVDTLETELQLAKDQVKELRIKLKIEPAGKSGTENNDNEPTVKKSVFELVRELSKNKTTKK